MDEWWNRAAITREGFDPWQRSRLGYNNNRGSRPEYWRKWKGRNINEIRDLLFPSVVVFNTLSK